MPTVPNHDELLRLAALAESLIVNCHQAQRAAKLTKMDEIDAALDPISVSLARQAVMAGDLKWVAWLLVQPHTRAACGLRFLAQVEGFLPAADVLELHELWEVPAVDKDAHLEAMLEEQRQRERERR